MSEKAPPSAIRRRIVFHLAGFDFADPAEHHRWFVRELARFGRTWNVQATASPTPEISAAIARWEMTTSGPNWRCETSYRVLRWDDIVRHEMSRNVIGRALRWMATFVDFVGTGTIGRYFPRSWPFGVFWVFTFLALPGFTLVATLLGLWIGGWPGLLAGGATFLALYLGPGRWFQVLHALDTLCFGRTYLQRRHPATTQRMQEFSHLLVEAVRESDADEIFLVGHSFGTILAIEVLAGALALNPELGRGKPAIRLLTLGSIIPFLALHPRGTFLRTYAAKVAAAIDWAEYQACDDPLHFYKVDPLNLEKQRDYPPGSRPMVRRVHVREMLSPETYRRFRFRFMRLHYQFLMGNNVRTRYDFYVFACGPIPFSRLVAAPGGPTDFFSTDGSLTRLEHS